MIALLPTVTPTPLDRATGDVIDEVFQATPLIHRERNSIPGTAFLDGHFADDSDVISCASASAIFRARSNRSPSFTIPWRRFPCPRPDQCSGSDSGNN